MTDGVVIHTVRGVRVAELGSESLASITWSRERNEVSRATVTVPRVLEEMEDITPWLHWITVWDCGVEVWRGPVQKVTMTRASVTLEGRDTSTLMWRTRTPFSRQWSSTDPARIALPLWEAMLDLHRVDVEPVINRMVTTSPFDFSCTANDSTLNTIMDDLVKLGLEWTVVAGTPVLGPMPVNPQTALAECDFLVDLERVRDGAQTANDVRLQGTNYAHTVAVPLGDLHLQTLVSMDDVYGVSNVTKAAREYAKRVATISDVLIVPSGAGLHPDAPITVPQLIPGIRVSVWSEDVGYLMRLESMEVTDTAGAYSIAVTLEADVELTELEMTGTADSSGALGRAPSTRR